jgi:hypothetical protein
MAVPFVQAIYLCARYGRRTELQGYAAQLQALGYVITSRWVLEPSAFPDDGRSAFPRALTRAVALQDWADVRAADTLICFTEDPDTPWSRGGRHIETGMALAWGHLVLGVGPEENIFHSLTAVQFDTFAEALTWMQTTRGA